MCLATPGEILTITLGDLAMGKVSFGGLVRDVCLAFVPEAKVGDYVLVHAGFAITLLRPEHAEEVFDYIARGMAGGS